MEHIVDWSFGRFDTNIDHRTFSVSVPVCRDRKETKGVGRFPASPYNPEMGKI